MKSFFMKYGLIIAVALTVVWGVVWSYHSAYKRGWNAAIADVQKKAQVQKDKQQAVQSKVSQNYQQDKTESEKKAEVRYVEVQKIVDRPVYINKCLDDDGVQLINKAINGH